MHNMFRGVPVSEQIEKCQYALKEAIEKLPEEDRAKPHQAVNNLIRLLKEMDRPHPRRRCPRCNHNL